MRDDGQRFEAVAAALTRRFGVAGTADATGLSADPGAYLLLIDLAADRVLDIAAFKDHRVTPGHYLYAGSANGPGGLRARLARHLRRDKKPHWHVDRLTVAAERMLAFPFPAPAETHAPVSPRPPSRGPGCTGLRSGTGPRIKVRGDTKGESIDAITECTLVETLLESGLYHHPLPGFGSSDCRTCMSHLLAPN
ncbi:MAG: DUF123 domain-containing protein [Rhodospirillaceae bacterium]|nr:DUF123 domain-containing protein [Rhodospirillaceae bacterium]MDD9918165.1 DUF123 domain-containing protein [Rhodospirillaceae bacterium]